MINQHAWDERKKEGGRPESTHDLGTATRPYPKIDMSKILPKTGTANHALNGIFYQASRQ
jgi:hypothetical protein